jgi:hypothetical protein
MPRQKFFRNTDRFRTPIRSHGLTFDGRHVWFASGEKLNALDPDSGQIVRSIDVAAHAGTAFDGRHLFQIAEDRIRKIDPETGEVLSSIPAPGAGGDSGLAWAEGSLWVGQHRGRKIHQIDPETGTILRTIESNRLVTGVSWIDGDLWHATWDDEAATCGASMPKPVRFWRSSTCRRTQVFRAWNPTAASDSSAVVAALERSGRSRRPRRKT